MENIEELLIVYKLIQNQGSCFALCCDCFLKRLPKNYNLECGMGTERFLITASEKWNLLTDSEKAIINEMHVMRSL